MANATLPDEPLYASCASLLEIQSGLTALHRDGHAYADGVAPFPSEQLLAAYASHGLPEVLAAPLMKFPAPH